ncbi:MAG: hypothetical protein JO001_20500 [Alphaproteobacteria bacterium]|nr:hypothetical protein [Alphaproteobacteria bacterium]
MAIIEDYAAIAAEMRRIKAERAQARDDAKAELSDARSERLWRQSFADARLRREPGDRAYRARRA